MDSLDSILTPDQAAPWLHMSKRELLSKCRGRDAKIPAFKLNDKVYRFSPRIIIAKLASDAGVSPETIAAAFGLVTEKD